MHIGVNALFFLPGEVGGTETYLIELLRAFERVDSVNTYTLFTQHNNHDLLLREFSGSRWSRSHLSFSAKNRPQRIIREQTELPIRARLAKIDLLWSPGYTMPMVAHCPQVATIHDMQYKSFPEDLSLAARIVTSLLVNGAAKFADRIIAVSEFSRGEILKHTGASPEKVVVTLEAAATDFQANLFGQLRDNGQPYLLCVANTYPHKSVDQLVRAFAKIQEAIPHDLILVGRPNRGEQRLQEAIKRLPFPERLHRRTGLSRSELATLYRDASAFVFPSQYEGFGLPVLEALMAGTPVVTTRCGSIPEIGKEAVAYFDHSSDDDLARVILNVLHRSEHERTEWRAKGEAVAAGFSWDETARKTLAIFASV